MSELPYSALILPLRRPARDLLPPEGRETRELGLALTVWTSEGGRRMLPEVEPKGS